MILPSMKAFDDDIPYPELSSFYERYSPDTLSRKSEKTANDALEDNCETFHSKDLRYGFLDESCQPLLRYCPGNTHNSSNENPVLNKYDNPTLFSDKSGPEDVLDKSKGIHLSIDRVNIKRHEILFHNSKSFFTRPEIWKLLLAFLYLILVLTLTSHVLVLVYMRAPTNSTWPNVAFRHLPDIFLDVLQRKEWAFKAAEILIQIFTFLIVVMIIFHQNTFVVLRRLTCHYASIFLIRTSCVACTSLLYIGDHHIRFCPPLHISSTQQFITRAMKIMFGVGLRVQGGNTCNDFIFSGHTSTLIILTLFFINYGPRRFYFIPFYILSIASCTAGTTFILMAHEHYTVDVIVAIIITLLYFHHYHSIAHSVELREQDYWRLVTISPVIFFMEHGGENKLDNKYRVPFIHDILEQKWHNWRQPRRRTELMEN
jgi:hypothetical protein